MAKTVVDFAYPLYFSPTYVTLQLLDQMVSILTVFVFRRTMIRVRSLIECYSTISCSTLRPWTRLLLFLIRLLSLLIGFGGFIGLCFLDCRLCLVCILMVFVRVHLTRWACLMVLDKWTSMRGINLVDINIRVLILLCNFALCFGFSFSLSLGLALCH